MPIGITTNVNCGLGKSKSKGQPGNLAHNRREFDPYNTDPILAVNNIFYANRSLEETYQTAFGDSIDEYISKQKRKDRITAFYEWRDKERQILKDICNCYGIETKTKAEEQADYRGETLPVDVYSNAIRDAKADAEVIKESAKIEAKHIRKEAESQADEMRAQAQKTLDTANSKAQEITESAVKKAEVLRSESNQLTSENDNLCKDNESYSKKNDDLGKQIALKSGLIAVPKKSLLGLGKNVVVNADEVEQLNEIHSNIPKPKLIKRDNAPASQTAAPAYSPEVQKSIDNAYPF